MKAATVDKHHEVQVIRAINNSSGPHNSAPHKEATNNNRSNAPPGSSSDRHSNKGRRSNLVSSRQAVDKATTNGAINRPAGQGLQNQKANPDIWHWQGTCPIKNPAYICST